MPKVSVVITTRNRALQLSRCLWSICEYGSLKPAEVCVVDDSSTDETPEVLESMRARYPIVKMRRERDGGWQSPSKPRNMALRMTAPDTDYIWFSEPEMLYPQDTLAKLLVPHQTEQNIWVNAVRQGFVTRPLEGEEWRYPERIWEASFVHRDPNPHLAVRCALVPRAMVFKVGGYDEWFGGGKIDEEGRLSRGNPGHDDTDFAARLGAAGCRAVNDFSINVMHQWHEAVVWNVADIDLLHVPHMQMNQRLRRYFVNALNWGTDDGRYPELEAEGMRLFA